MMEEARALLCRHIERLRHAARHIAPASASAKLAVQERESKPRLGRALRRAIDIARGQARRGSGA